MTIDASPTKEFFISMLTRDVPLDRSILDLIDNSVDAAVSQSGDLSSKKITIDISEKKFTITDNCGGMPKTAAERYAFKFGRDKNSPPTPDSVGQFGVGMKRTLFKIGKVFEVKSLHPNGSFTVNVNVNDWLADESVPWTFPLTEINYNGEIFGTTITVTGIPENIGTQFGLENYINDLRNDIKKAHFKSIEKGLKIIVNDEEISSYSLAIRSSEILSAVHHHEMIDDVSVRIIVGVGERELTEGGWYVVCNGRLIEEAEQTTTTGWQTSPIPKYHPDYAFFRGLVEFECSDSSKLPWTTTKHGVDRDNKVYRAALSIMKDKMSEVLSYLKDRAKEQKRFKDNEIDGEQRVLNAAYEEAKITSVYEIPENSEFEAPDPVETKKRTTKVSVQYKVDKKKLQKVKDHMGIDLATRVGEETFNYYYEYECGDE